MRGAALLAIVLAFPWVVGPPVAGAGDGPPPPPAPTAGPTYANPDIGLTVEGPSGWTLASEKSAVSPWTRLCTFSDAASGSVATVSARKASAVTLPRLREELTRAYATDPTVRVSGIVDLPSGGKRPWPGLLVDATQTIAPEPVKPGTPPAPTPPTPTVHRILDAYYLAGEWEVFVHTQARATLFSRYQPLIDRMIQGVTLKPQGSANAPRGEGAFRDETNGFSCRFPTGYGVRVPGRANHVVEFAPAGDGPVLGVYVYDSESNLDREAETLVEYYTGPEVGGEASIGQREIAGQSALVVTANGRLGGRDQAFLVAVLKRAGQTFRLRVAADRTQEGAGRAAFDAFVKSFKITNL